MRFGVAFDPAPSFLEAVLPLLEAGSVEALLVSVEPLLDAEPLPGPVEALLAEFGRHGALSLHGIVGSPLGPEPRRHADTCARLPALVRRFHPLRLSEHYGFTGAPGFAHAAPLPVPCDDDAFGYACQRLTDLARAAGVPVGLENLAFAFSEQDVWDEPRALRAILDAVDGFLVLDVHNLLCRIRNFGLDVDALLAAYPLDRVREIHVAGGRDDAVVVEAAPCIVRRDTHDEAVPDDALALLARVLPRVPTDVDVFYERAPWALTTFDEKTTFRGDHARIAHVLEAFR